MNMPSLQIRKVMALTAVIWALLLLLMVLSARQEVQDTVQAVMVESERPIELLPLQLQQRDADFALPFCEKKNCVDVYIQTVYTQDQWLNGWIENRQATVLQDQIGLKQKLSLQAAIDAYVKKSDAWQAELKTNKAYRLGMSTRIAAQRGPYVLLQLGVDAQQAELSIKDRYYFYVADRRLQKQVSLLDVIDPTKRNAMHLIVQQGYQDWLKQQSKAVRANAANVLYWGQADWFFDQEGIGLHYRGQEISNEAPQLDLYLTKAQTQQMLLAEVYQQLF